MIFSCVKTVINKYLGFALLCSVIGPKTTISQILKPVVFDAGYVYLLQVFIVSLLFMLL